MKRVIFVTGTDTGVGKTMVTTFLLHLLRDQGLSALAMKPFATGDRNDLKAMQRIQAGCVADDLVNPFFFPKPVAPMVAAKQTGKTVTLRAVLASIQAMRQRCNVLLIEGAGGLLAPLGEGFFTAKEIIKALRCDVVVVAKNRLGTLNHTALVIRELKRNSGARRICVVLNNASKRDASTPSNGEVLREWLGLEVAEMPNLGAFGLGKWKDEVAVKKMKKVLATILC